MSTLVIGGMSGQIARELAALDVQAFGMVVSGRPETDLADPASLSRTIADVRPDVVMLSCAYTVVDQAETDETNARVINARGPAAVGSVRGCRLLGRASVD